MQTLTSNISRVLALAVLAIAVWPMLRLLNISGFRQKLRAFPLAAYGLAASLVAYTGVAITLAIHSPRVLTGVAAMAAVGIAYERWRARPSYGHARGLPPGSIGIATPDPWQRRGFYAQEAARWGPVFKTCYLMQPVVCIVGLRLGSEVLRRHDDALFAPSMPYNRFVPQGFLRYMNPEARRAYAPLFRAAFTTQVVDDARDDVEAIVRQRVERMAADSAGGTEEGLQPADAIKSMVFAAFARVVFGIDRDAPVLPRLEHLISVIDYERAWRTPPARVRRALAEIARILDEQVGHLRRESDSGSVRASILSKLVESAPESMTNPTITYNLAYILMNGTRDVASLVNWLVKMLCDHQAWWVRVRAATVSADLDQDLPGRIVRETLRLAQSEYLLRGVKADIHVNGYLIPKGWQVRICVQESHRLADAFRDPDRFDPDRSLSQSYARPEYSPFGASRITCLGDHLTLTLGRAFVTELARGFDLSLVSEGPLELDVFHWRPSSRLRVRLTPGGPSRAGASA